MIHSVCGEIAPEELGHCQIHEHIYVRPTPMSGKNPALCIDCFDRSLEELRSYKAAGGTTLVDAQPVGAGRDAALLERMSRDSGVSIIASTGCHLLGFYPQESWIHRLDEEELYALYRDEIDVGMLPWQPDASSRPKSLSGIRAGLVKAAIPEEGPVGRYKILLRACARAAADTGVPLMLHTEFGRQVEAALTLCFACGMAPEKLVVCHVDRQTADWGVHDAAASAGVYLDYDTVGRFKYHSDEEEIALLWHMVDAGFEDRILLALDTTAARLTSYGGEIGLDYLLTRFLPRLKREGLPETIIRKFNLENCRRLFSYYC